MIIKKQQKQKAERGEKSGCASFQHPVVLRETAV
jgi:hypothetical protein